MILLPRSWFTKIISCQYTFGQNRFFVMNARTENQQQSESSTYFVLF